ncbi:putative DNA mismatch repair protein MSH6-2 [Tripterygium wilfordii]|uniref:Putative DNA mismatch repair protein MSH6-2 n=1 Tax=Tripterygium wilfordii TaxID=458696 RepID=A0A7J7DR14_TRIWF|nr:DNA mismatch repair protein MSH7 isoform X2 [Tripterygium wilfordii]KAF5748604.1 putative DNA mismatch repair protein MSH6-2 [Tripterygium wilfordii]
MQRHTQKSILSFFQKPSPVNQKKGPGYSLNGGGGLEFQAEQPHQKSVMLNQPPVQNAVDSSLEIRGTDTPPEKVPRQILPAGFVVNEDSGGSSLFSSIMHKFVKVDDKEKPKQRNQVHSSSSNICLVSADLTKPVEFPKDVDDDAFGSHTPGLRPLVPRLKRDKDDSAMFEDKSYHSSLDATKRVKLLRDSTALNKKCEEISDTASKFEWLDPSLIRDSNGRRPGDALYDKKTLLIPPDSLKKMSASQKQYWSIKSQYMDVVLFFKVGKFYELYELDAELGHKELDWKMTFSGVGKCRQVGISESGIDEAVQKLVARGYKVGRIEQLETSDQAKARGANSVISRKLVHVVTPSTIVDGNIGPDAVHLLALKEDNQGQDNGSNVFGFAFVDCAALRFWVGSIKDNASCAALGALLMQVSPKEVIYDSRGLSKEAQKALRKYSGTGSTALQLTPVLADNDFVNAYEVRNTIQLRGYFKGSSIPLNNQLDGLEHHDIAFGALGGLICHLSRLMLDDVLRNGDILPYQVYRGCLRMDGQTLVNLEIFNNNADGGSSGTLFKYLDSCVMSSGKRLLRSWISHPLKDVDGINNRLNVVEDLMAHSELMLVISQYLRKVPDIERLLGRVKASVQASSHLLPMIGKKVLKQRVKVFGLLVKGLRVAVDLLVLLQSEGKLVLSLSKNFKLPKLEGDDGLDKLLNQFIAAVDSDFSNYQNHDVTDSDAETLSILIELFIEKAAQWSEVIHAINCIDVLRSFAFTASTALGVMSRPVILPQSKTSFSLGSLGPLLKIKGLWHPFALGENGGMPVSNDLCLGGDSDGYNPRTLLLTGPNMGGKSTLLRATCIAVILAQLGCFVPSEICVVSLVDIIFTRLGATDRIMTGESTFLVECTETSSILQNATQDSLVLLDELGRGTSTFDGYAIAYAVFRHLVEKVDCRLLFATHYHPLTKEFASHPHVIMQHMSCAFKSKPEGLSKGEQELIFLYRLTNGACPESYGLQVALMAGIPKPVVEAALQGGQLMKKSIGESFRSSEHRSEFSTLHEGWLKTLLNVSLGGDCNFDGDDDAYDTLFCLWHEVKNKYRH